MGSNIKIFIQGLVLLFIQVAILKRISIEVGDVGYLHFIIYPLFILLFPINTSRYLLLIIAFVYGLSIDVFYDSPGVHAAALVIMAYSRNMVLRLIAPYEGYKIDDKPYISVFGPVWFASYIALLLFIHLLFYFGFESFSMVFLLEISLNTMMSLIVSVLLIFTYMLIVRPKK